MNTLYQKYRPFSWNRIAGNSRTVKELQKRVIEQTIPAAIYITGTTGTGKSTIARLLAACITCEHVDKEGNPCGKCRHCNDILDESFSIATYNYNASNLGIEEMRRIDEISSTYSISSKYRIMIIDELQELNANKKAMKNILVSIERQAKYVFWILLSMDDDKVDKAIKNRCVSYKLQDIDSVEIAKYLKFICDSEKVDVKEEQFNALFTISENCGGSMRTAISYLERVIEGEIWNEEDVISELGIISNNVLGDLILKLLTGDPEVLKTEFNAEIISKTRWLLSLAYKEKAGLALNKWQESQIKQIKHIPIESIQNTIKNLNEISNYVYSDKLLIETIIIDCLIKNKENAAPKRRVLK